MNDSTPDNNEQPLTGQTPSDTRPPLVLVTDVITPRPDQDSGSMDTVHYIRMLMELGYETVFCPYDLTHDGEYTYALQKLGVRCLHKPETESLQEHLAAYGNLYDILFLNRLQHAGDLMTDIRRHCNNARKIFNTVDLHFLREQRQAKAEDSNELLDKAEETRQIELELMRQCDATILISEVETSSTRRRSRS